MRAHEPGKIGKNLWRLGVKESTIYFLRGGRGAALINGGMSYILPEVLAQMSGFGLDPGEISKMLILHSHFDHLALVPYFKRNYPAIDVLASEAALKTFENPRAVGFINSYNELSAGDKKDSLKSFDLEWRSDITVSPVREGDSIDLGGVALRIYETPGHSNCSIAAYEPDDGVLFASDAVAIPFKDKLCPSMNTNVNQYLESLEKLQPLKVNMVCADHFGSISGEEAQTFVSDTIREASAMKGLLYETFRRNPDIDVAAKEFTTLFYKEMPDYFLSPEILEGVFKQIFKFVSKNPE